MNKYYNHQQTPLLFHRLYWLGWTPAQIAIGAMTIVNTVGSSGTMDLWARIDLAYGAVTCLLMLAYFIGFFKWKLYGWCALMSQLVLNVGYAFVAVFALDDRSFAMSLLVGTLIRCIPVGIYYAKRRPLFSAKGFDIPAMGPIVPQQRNSQWNSGHNMNGQWQNPQNQWQNPQNQWDNPQEQQQPAAGVNFTADGERIYYCPECGNMVKQHSSFCIHCGAKL